MPIFFVDVRQDLVYAYGCPSRPLRPIWKVKRAPKRAYPSFRRFSCSIAHDFLGDPYSDVKNAKFFRGRLSRPCLCIRLAITACPTHLEAHNFLGDRDSDVKNAKFFRGRPSRPFLCIRFAITACPIHLADQTIPEVSIPLISTIFDYDVKNAKFFRGRPSRPCVCIRLAITACPTHLEAHHFLVDPDFDVKNANFFRGRLSRPCLCIRLAITACPTHFEGQTSPEASIPLISMIFMCYSTPSFG
uniref:Uncharacterized protein n=1 Tax=Solanum lycopersicum TaxID=4081 RepID=A0A3Q7GDT5_SOLLC